MAKNTKKRLRNVDKVAELLGGTVHSYSDNSLTWVSIDNDKFRVEIEFDSTGKDFEGVVISEKIYAVVNEKVVARLEKRKSKQ
jgi:hypothetical protein